MPTIYFPMMWFSLEVEAGERFTDDLKKLLSLPIVCMYAGAVMIAIGFLIFFTLAFLYLLKRHRAKSTTNDKAIQISSSHPERFALNADQRFTCIFYSVERQAGGDLESRGQIGTGVPGQE